MSKLNIVTKSDINEHMGEMCLFISTTWNISDTEKITWTGFDMDFEEFFDFSSKLKNNEECSLGGNSYWGLDHSNGSDYCKFEFVISGMESGCTFELEINKETMIEVTDAICNEIKKFQEKYPNTTRF